MATSVLIARRLLRQPGARRSLAGRLRYEVKLELDPLASNELHSPGGGCPVLSEFVALVATVVVTQLVIGAGAWFPYAAPALWMGMGGAAAAPPPPWNFTASD
jgi:hypothetical protein